MEQFPSFIKTLITCAKNDSWDSVLSDICFRTEVGGKGEEYRKIRREMWPQGTFESRMQIHSSRNCGERQIRRKEPTVCIWILIGNQKKLCGREGNGLVIGKWLKTQVCSHIQRKLGTWNWETTEKQVQKSKEKHGGPLLLFSRVHRNMQKWYEKYSSRKALKARARPAPSPLRSKCDWMFLKKVMTRLNLLGTAGQGRDALTSNK